MKVQNQGVYVSGTSADTEDILDFANMVFSMEYNGINFEKLYPKAYSAERCHIPVHHMIKEGNKIRALVDVYPLTLRQGSNTIKAAYIGTVSVHHSSRGKGYMIALMEKAEEQARKDGCDIMLLDGDRHRYQHYGFERAGMKCLYQIETGNIRHCCNALYPENNRMMYRFELLAQEQPDFEAILDTLYALYQQRVVTARSHEDFWWCLQSEEAETYVIYTEDCLAGYVCVSKDWKNIFEFEVTALSQLPQIIDCFMEELEIDQLQISVGMDESGKIEYLDKMSNYCLVGASHMIRILDYKNVLLFLLEWKKKYSKLANGEYVIGIVGGSEQTVIGNYRICVAGNDADEGESWIDVQETNMQADIVLEEKEFVQTLTTSYYFYAQNHAKSPLGTVPTGWFPLPFFLPNADAF